MATFPFERQKPSGYAYGEVPTSAQLNVIDEQAAAAASGAIWSDLSLGKMWHKSAAVAEHGYAIAWNSTQKRWYSFGVNGGGNPLGAYLPIGSATWTTGLSLPAGSGLTPWAAATNPSGVTVVGGRPGSSSTSKIRESSDGSTWNARNTVASGLTIVKALIWHSGASKFIAGLDNEATTNIETSPDGQTWTQVTGLPNSLPRTSFASNGTTVVCCSNTFGGDAVSSVLTSTDGTNWVQRSLPLSGFVKDITWEAHRGIFILILSNRCLVSEDGATWTDVRSHSAGAVKLVANSTGRAMVFARGNSKLVYHGHYDENARRMRTNIAFEMSDEFVPDISAGASLATGNGQFMVSDTTGTHYWTMSPGA